MDIFATALPALGDAASLIFQPIVFGYLVLGVVMGDTIVEAGRGVGGARGARSCSGV